MSSRGVLYFTLFLAIAGVTGIFIRAYLTEPEDGTKVEAVEEGPKAIFAVRDLGVGTFITLEDLEWRPWTGPGELVLSQHFVENDAVREQLVGAIVRQPLVAGEPITASGIVKVGERGFLAAVLRPGKRAVSVSIDAVSSSSGLIFPGDHVDVILTVEIDDRDRVRTLGDRLAGETILRDLRVIAVGQRVETLAGRADDEPVDTAVAKTATLEVSPSDAERLTVASHIGSLALSLRSLSEQEDGSRLVARSDDGGEPLAAAGRKPKTVWAADVANALRTPPPPPPPVAKPPRAAKPTLTLMRGGMPSVEVQR